MMIPVIYYDHSHDLVEACSLTTLLREGRIKSFKRSTGWVDVQIDRIRKFDYVGQERIVAGTQNENYVHDLRSAHL